MVFDDGSAVCESRDDERIDEVSMVRYCVTCLFGWWSGIGMYVCDVSMFS
jgi:hypothetical protein